PLTASYGARSVRGDLGRDELVAQTLMWSFLMIVIDERADGGSEVLLAEWHDAIQALRFDGPDKSLGKGVQIGTPSRQAQGLHTTVPQPVPEGGRVEGIAVQNEVFGAAEEVLFGVGQVPCDLRHPVLVRLRGDPSDLHGAGLEFDDEKHD